VAVAVADADAAVFDQAVGELTHGADASAPLV
jgi:hypothetical protein